MKSSTLHIKVRADFAQRLKNLSKKRHVPMGELVREAVSAVYQIDLANLGESQRLAVSAYQGGYISIGKLAEELGMNVFETRTWLHEHDIAQNNSFAEGDAARA